MAESSLQSPPHEHDLPSTADHQSAAVEHEAPAVEHEAPAVEHEAPDVEHQPDTPPASPLSYLGPDSYTLHRLQHATPEHLYLTTRRAFIGPIPEGWLRSHRRDWYRRHLHLDASSRSATFSAAPNTGSRRSVTGLDSLTKGKWKQSFPQPQDASQEQGEADADDGNQAGEPGASTEQAASTTASAGATPINVPGKEEPQGDADQHLRPDLSRTRSSKTGKATFKSARSKLSRSTSDGSFVTAQESPASSIPVQAPISTPTDASDGTLRNAQSIRSETPLLRTSTIGDQSRPDSITGLIQSSDDHQNEQRPEQNLAEGKKRRKTALLRNRSEPPALDAASLNDLAVTPSTKPKPHTGLVRFNLPDKAAQDEVVKVRLAQHRGRETINKLRGDKTSLGEIVKVEKMLVRVDFTSHEMSPDFDEKDCERIEARTIDKWREFIVVCRESTEDDSEYVLQMYKSRVIPATQKTHVRKRSAHEIALTSKTAKINIFSSLDKTIAMWHPDKGGNRVYIMRPRSASSAMEWYTFLRSLLGWQRASTLQINVPDLSVSLQLEHPFGHLESSRDLVKAAQGDSDAIAKTVKEEQAVAGNLVARSMMMLENSTEFGNLVDEWAIPHARLDDPATAVNGASSSPNVADSRRPNSAASAKSRWSALSSQQGGATMGLAWKRYDRLEWVHGNNEKAMYGTIGMEKSHELELRPKQHYPCSVHTKKGKPLEEPPPVEGFLIRLTSHKGVHQRKRKLYHKRLYFSTHDQFLVFNRPTNAYPPKPPALPTSTGSKIPSAAQIAHEVPLIYAVNPYPIQNGDITWLVPQKAVKPADLIQRDDDASFESQRNINILQKCDGIIDLLNVTLVRNVQRGAAAVDEVLDEGSDVDFHQNVDDTRHEDGEVRDMDDERTFELVLKNGLVIRLQAFDKATKREWMMRLKGLVRYWSRRISADTALYKSVRMQNLDALHIDEELEAFVGQFAEKWEVTRSFASPEVYHMCGISCCRSIALSGTLFRKSRMHGTFRESRVLLSHGSLLIFHHTMRSITGRVIQHIHNERMTAVNLSECYIYSGLITSNDLLYGGSAGYDRSRPGQGRGLPKIYEDGWTVQDEEEMTCFVIWHGKKKSWFRSEQTNKKDGKRSKLKRVSQLGKEGNSVVFKARSRAERDHWVQAISIEIERLAQSADVRIVEKKHV